MSPPLQWDLRRRGFGASTEWGLHPETLFAVPGMQEVRVLSDDGQRKHHGVACMALRRRAQGFRSWGPG